MKRPASNYRDNQTKDEIGIRTRNWELLARFGCQENLTAPQGRGVRCPPPPGHRPAPHGPLCAPWANFPPHLCRAAAPPFMTTFSRGLCCCRGERHLEPGQDRISSPGVQESECPREQNFDLWDVGASGHVLPPPPSPPQLSGSWCGTSQASQRQSLMNKQYQMEASSVMHLGMHPPPSLPPTSPFLSLSSFFRILSSQAVTHRLLLSLRSVGFSEKVISLSLLLIRIDKRLEGRRERGGGRDGEKRWH